MKGEDLFFIVLIGCSTVVTIASMICDTISHIH